MIKKPGFNREKLRRFIIKNKDLHAAYVQICEDINFLIRTQIPEFERHIKDAAQKVGLNHNREVFNARNEGREPAKHIDFMDYKPDEMLEAFKGHPIAAHIDYSMVQRYVRFKNELKALRDHQTQIEEELKPRRALVNRCLEFLQNNGLTKEEIGLGVE